MRFVETPGIGTTLIQLVDDQRKLLSRLEVLELTIWFSGVKIPVAGIAGVYTPPGLRKKGYATNCLKHAIRKQQRKDKCLLMLFGERDFYARFGLTPIGPWYGIYVSQKLAALPPLEPVDPSHSAEVPKDVPPSFIPDEPVHSTLAEDEKEGEVVKDVEELEEKEVLDSGGKI